MEFEIKKDVRQLVGKRWLCQGNKKKYKIFLGMNKVKNKETCLYCTMGVGGWMKVYKIGGDQWTFHRCNFSSGCAYNSSGRNVGKTFMTLSGHREELEYQTITKYNSGPVTTRAFTRMVCLLGWCKGFQFV